VHADGCKLQPWLAVYGGDPARPEQPDLGWLMKRVQVRTQVGVEACMLYLLFFLSLVVAVIVTVTVVVGGGGDVMLVRAQGAGKCGKAGSWQCRKSSPVPLTTQYEAKPTHPHHAM